MLENYLSRAVTSQDLLTDSRILDANIAMLKNIGAKFAGRAVYRWGTEAQLPEILQTAKKNAAKVHQADAEIILQAAAFEIVTTEVERLAVPARVFKAFGRPVESRNFSYASMLFPKGTMKDHWSKGSSVPDISRPETKLWFYYLAACYIDIGVEAIHFGQVELMGRNDPDCRHWDEVLKHVRRYAARNARRRFVLCDGHVPSHGLMRGKRTLLDFNSFPLLVVEVPERPQEGVLKMGHLDTIYGRSRGGRTPSGWQCEHLPYLVEVDNWGSSKQPGKPGLGGGWVWGYDEMSWFAHQDEAYRNHWLRYAWRWVREHDPAGFLQMPCSRVVHSPVEGRWWYWANSPSKAIPHGYNQEPTIKAIWAADSHDSQDH